MNYSSYSHATLTQCISLLCTIVWEYGCNVMHQFITPSLVIMNMCRAPSHAPVMSFEIFTKHVNNKCFKLTGRHGIAHTHTHTVTYILYLAWLSVWVCHFIVPRSVILAYQVPTWMQPDRALTVHILCNNTRAILFKHELSKVVCAYE